MSKSRVRDSSSNHPELEARASIPAIVRALRPHQWSKNLLMAIPVLAAHDESQFVAVALGFVPFCLAASAVYILNDLVDLSSDRAHPRKRLRPFAAGEIRVSTGLLMALGLLVSAFVFSWFFCNQAFILVLLTYLTATFAYSFWLKRTLLADILSLAGLYTLRVFAGGAVAGITLSPWLLGFSMFIFLSLAAVKRQAELVDQANNPRENTGRTYEVNDLPIIVGLALASSVASILMLALYIGLQDIQGLYTRPELLWLICPLVLYWVLRMIMKAHRGQMTDDPIVFAATDRVGLSVGILCGFIAFAAAFEKLLQ